MLEHLVQSQQGLGRAGGVSYAEEFGLRPKSSRESQKDFKQDRSIVFALWEHRCGWIRGASAGNGRWGRRQSLGEAMA